MLLLEKSSFVDHGTGADYWNEVLFPENKIWNQEIEINLSTCSERKRRLSPGFPPFAAPVVKITKK